MITGLNSFKTFGGKKDKNGNLWLILCCISIFVCIVVLIVSLVSSKKSSRRRGGCGATMMTIAGPPLPPMNVPIQGSVSDTSLYPTTQQLQQTLQQPQTQDGENKEGFLRSKFATAYACTGQVMKVNDWDALDEAAKNIDTAIRKSQNMSSLETFDEADSAYTADVQTSTEDTEASKRQVMSSLNKKPIGKIKQCNLNEPVKGFSNGNTRVNGKFPPAEVSCLDFETFKPKGVEPFKKLANAIIDDKGYGNPEAFIPNDCSAPMCTNSRLAGSKMNVNSLIGAFGKFDTDNGFFSSTSPKKPELNIAKGKPLPLKYCPNPNY